MAPRPLIAAALAVAVSALLHGVVPVLGSTPPPEPVSQTAGGPQLLLADTTHVPRVTVSWPTREGPETKFEGDRPYRSPGDKTHLGDNIDAYVALGGARLDKGAGNPEGAIVRVGLYKADARKPFFENLADDATITVRVDGIVMNQPASARPRTGLMHLRYMPADLANCGIAPDGRNLYITASKDDKILKVVGEASARPGALDGEGPAHGSVTTETHADGSLSVTYRFPYALLRHIKDPSKREAPGGFFEPQHFHCEVEVLPKAVAEAEDHGGH